MILLTQNMIGQKANFDIVLECSEKTHCKSINSMQYVQREGRNLLCQLSKGIDIERALYINGEIPFSGADTLTFSRIWTEEAAYVRLWTDTFYFSLFLRKFGLLSVAIGGLGDNLVQYIVEISNRTQIPSTAYQQAIISTGTLMIIASLLIIYLVAQKGFVQSVAQTGIKM
jgi:hypothetical protein